MHLLAGIDNAEVSKYLKMNFNECLNTKYKNVTPPYLYYFERKPIYWK